nr:cell division topological specificity factor MinE [Roseofilum casamattae]
MLNDLLERLLPWTARPSSRDAVKQRLKVVLAYDRAGISPGILEEMQKDIVAVLSRYVELDDEQLQFSIENSDRATALIANFPIRRIKGNSEESSVASTPDVEEMAKTLEELTEEEQEPNSELEELFLDGSPTSSELDASASSADATATSDPANEQTITSSKQDSAKLPEKKSPQVSDRKVRKSSKSE